MPQDPLHLLCIEPRFPGRIAALADWLVRRRGYRCWFFCQSADGSDYWPASVGNGLELVQFNVGGVAQEPSVPWTRNLERGLCYAFGCWEVLHAKRPQPIDLILGHSAGLGSTLFAPVYQPRTPIVNLFHYYYHARAHDLTGDTPANTPVEYYHWRRAANAMDLLDLENGVVPWTHSEWQRDLFPGEYHDDFVVVPDGVDTRRFPITNNREERRPRTIAGRTLSADVRIVTFIARATDKLRGFDRFLELANRLHKARSDVLCIVVGGPVTARGLDVQSYNQDYRAALLQTMPLHDPERFWFLDSVRQDVVADVCAASDLHVYPSRPFPVSRSLMEAMASGCVVLAWDTAPVRERITHEHTGLLTPENDMDAAERAALGVLDDPAAFRQIGNAAAELVREKYSQDVAFPQLAELFNSLADG